MASSFTLKNLFRYLIFWGVGLVLGVMVIGGLGGFFDTVMYFDGKPLSQFDVSKITSSTQMTSISIFNFFGKIVKLNGNYSLEVLLVVSLIPILLDKLVQRIANR